MQQTLAAEFPFLDKCKAAWKNWWNERGTFVDLAVLGAAGDDQV
jgi:hypothetical protein